MPRDGETEIAYQKRLMERLEQLMQPDKSRTLKSAQVLLEAEALNSVAVLMHARDHAPDVKTRANVALEMLKLSMPKPETNVNITAQSKSDQLLELWKQEMELEGKTIDVTPDEDD